MESSSTTTATAAATEAGTAHKNPHHYFVTYVAPGNRAGNAQINLALPIRSMDDITFIQSFLESENGLRDVLVTGWQRFEELPG